MKMNKDSQIEFINEEDLDLLGGANETDMMEADKTCGNLLQCGWNNQDCPKLEKCNWN